MHSSWTPTRYRLAALTFAALAAFVVAVGWVPGWYTVEQGERLLGGLFALSPLDDITHGLTAVAFAVAATRSSAWQRQTFILFGSYYALDAVFYLSYGLVNDKTWLQDLMLNLPHVVISSTMLWLGHLVGPEVERASLASAAR